MANRKFKITDKIFDTILKHIENGNSLRSALKMPNMPCNDRFYAFLDEKEERQERYLRARERRTEVLFEEILDIADDSRNDKIKLEDGRTIVDNEFVQRSKLRIHARQWMLGKMNPTKYGDKLDLTTKGKAFEQSKIHVSLDGKDLDLSTEKK